MKDPGHRAATDEVEEGVLVNREEVSFYLIDGQNTDDGGFNKSVATTEEASLLLDSCEEDDGSLEVACSLEFKSHYSTEEHVLRAVSVRKKAPFVSNNI